MTITDLLNQYYLADKAYQEYCAEVASVAKSEGKKIRDVANEDTYLEKINLRDDLWNAVENHFIERGTFVVGNKDALSVIVVKDEAQNKHYMAAYDGAQYGNVSAIQKIGEKLYEGLINA